MFNDRRPGKYIAAAVLSILVLSALFLFLGEQARTTPETGTETRATELAEEADKRFLDIKEITTQAGIDIWLVQDDTLPIIAMRYIFRGAGTALDPQERQGLVRLLSNTMDEGAGELDAQAFQKELSDHSITLNFSAGRDGFGGTLKMLSRHRERSFELLAKALTDPRFDERPLQRMRDANLSRIRSSLSRPEWIAARIMNDRAYEGHPYSLNSGGTLSGLNAITADDLLRFKEENLTRDRLLVTIAGDIGAEDAARLVDQTFASLPAKPAHSHEISAVTLKNTGKIFLYEQNIPQTIIDIMMPAFGRDDPDYYALQALNYILGGAGFGSRLMEEAREKRGLTYGIYSSLSLLEHNQALSISTSTKNEQVEEMLSVIVEAFQDLRENPVPHQELEDAKSYLIGSMPLALTSTEQIAAMMLSLRMDDAPSTYLDEYADNIRKITPADLKNVASRVFEPQNTVMVLVGEPHTNYVLTPVESLPNVE